MNASRIALRVPTCCDPEAVVKTARALPTAWVGRTLRKGDKVFSPATELLMLVESTSPLGGDKVAPATTFDITVPKRPRRQAYEALVVVESSTAMDLDDVTPTRFEAALDAVERFLANAGPFLRRTAIGSFGVEFKVLQGLVPMADLEPGRAAKIPLRGPSGATVHAVESGIDHLVRHADPSHRKALVMIVGEPEEGPTLMDPVARTARLGGVEVHAVVLGGAGGGSDWLHHLAGATHGTFAQAASPSALEGAFRAMGEAVGDERAWEDTARFKGKGLVEQDPEVEVVIHEIEEETHHGG